MKQNILLSITALVLVICASSIFLQSCQYNEKKTATSAKQKIVINEAARTLLYLPIYHAKEAGFFEKNGVDVEIITGGTGTASFAAMTRGEAQFAVADPMYVPIANEKNGNTRVVAQIVSKIAVWGLTMNKDVTEMNNQTLLRKTISTHNKPLTAYAYTVKTIQDAGLKPDVDVMILQNKPGNEITPLLLGKAEFAMTLEPSVAIAQSRGAKVILSYPQLLGDQIFTGLLAKQDYIEQHKDQVLAILLSLQEAIDDIYANKDAALKTTTKYFPQLKPDVAAAAVNHVLREGVIPRSLLMTDESWNKAIAIRVKQGDLHKVSSRAENVRTDLINEAIKKIHH